MKASAKQGGTAKTAYNMGQNSWFMIKLAWTSGEKKVLVLNLLTALLAVALNLINLYVSPAILSAVERHSQVSELVWTIAGFALGLMLVSAAAAYVKQNVMFGRISVRMELINLINMKAATTSYPNVDDEGFRNLLTQSGRYVNSNDGAAEAVWGTLTDLLTNAMGFAIYIALLSAVQPVLMLVIIAATTMSYFIGNRLNSYGYRHRDEEAEHERHMYYISERARDLSAAKDIRIFGLKPWLIELQTKAMSAYTAFHSRAEGVYIWARIADLALAFVRNAVAYAYLIALVVNEGLDVSEFLLYFTAVGGFAEWITGILGGLNTLYRQSLDLSVIRQCIEYPEPFKLEGGAHAPVSADGRYEIRLEDVSFRYPGAEDFALRHIDLTLHPGEKLAVVGLNGAGKTTLIKLICGFLDPTEGRVLINGQDVRELNRTEYYAMFAAVFQNFSLLPASIAANVAQDDVDIDMARVRECVDRAGLRGRIESLPQGYDTHLDKKVYEDAVELSGGETQRLMLARALYRDAPFIVLDEPTAALDPIAEYDMYRKYDEMTRGKSSIYISHRLASTRFCDRIIMIDCARICEEGTHEKLLRLNGKYAQLYEVQSRYYREGEAENGQ